MPSEEFIDKNRHTYEPPRKGSACGICGHPHNHIYHSPKPKEKPNG